MSIPSNLYAEKVFGEHPIGLWPFDEAVDYIQLIPAANRDISDTDIYTLDGCSVSESESDAPIVGENVYQINSSSLEYSITDQNPLSSYVNPDLESITLGFYFNPASSNLRSLDIGYVYGESEEVAEVSDIDFELNQWYYVSKTLPLPETVSLSIPFADFTNDEDPSEGFTEITYNAHGLSDGDKIKLSSSYIVPNLISQYHIYYVVNATENTFEVEESIGSGSIEFFYQFGNLFITPVLKLKPLIKFYSYEAIATTSYICGLSAGQWSSEFMENSFGVSSTELSGINVDNEYYYVEGAAYGFQDLSAYYLVRENKLLAKNTNMPIVYGSSNLTSLIPERFGGPSMIFPGLGFLNEDGRYKTHTVEFWLRISPDTDEPKRIFGPINSSDGLYVDGPFITLKVGESVQSHYIGEWYRPMLINLLTFRNGSSLIINGEKVIDLSFNTSELDLPSKTSLSGKDQDWLGFYSYEDIFQFEIDCVAIYSYRVPTAVSKRRFVYGQAIDFPYSISSAYSGKSFPVDYTFANYNNNYIYPDMVKWRSGVSENISSENNVLQPPKYSLPSLVFNNKTSDAWYRALKSNAYQGISLKPDDSWIDTDGYLFFDSPNVLNQKTAGFYGLFRPEIGMTGTQSLFVLENKVTGNYLDVSLATKSIDIASIDGTVLTSNSHDLQTYDVIRFEGSLPSEIIAGIEYYVTKIDDDTFSISNIKDGDAISISSIAEDSVEGIYHVIQYSLTFNSNEEVIYQTPAIALGTTIVAGLNFIEFAKYFGGNVSTLIGNRRQLKLYVGGNKNFSNTFSGNIYRVGFSTLRNIDKLDYLFSSNGTPFLRYQFEGGSDTSYDDDEFTGITIDAGYTYEEYVDDILSHTASYTLVVKSFFGERYLDIATSSYWQDYVPLTYLAKNTFGLNEEISYKLDFIQYNSDTTVPLFFDDEDNYDTSSSSIKTYVTFQTIASGPTKTEEQFVNTQKLGRNKTIVPGENWRTTKYEVVNQSLIYLPQDIGLDELAMVVHMDMSSSGIIKNPIRVRSMSLSGKSFNASKKNPIGTKRGVSMYPYNRYGIYYDYNKQTPFVIYKDSTPHLYLTKHSGIELAGDFTDSNRGLSLLINEEKTAQYKLSTIQFSARFTRDDLVTEPVEIMHLETNFATERIKIWIEPAYPSNKRFRIFATNNNDERIRSLYFYVNGKRVADPTISINDWNMISIGLETLLDLDGISGKLNVVGPIMVNNISYYALNNLQQAQLEVLSATEYVGIDPEVIYGIFTGTNKVIVGDDIASGPKNIQYSVINNISVQSATIKPV